MNWLSKYLLLIGCVGGFGAIRTQCQAQAQTETLVWSDEFSGPSAVPNPANWRYEVGGDGWGNQELETYCAPTTAKLPCDPAQPNARVMPDGMLHLVARRDAAGNWTSARMVSKGLRSFQYGRIEARIRIPEGEGVWPAFWMLGADVDKTPWPGCGELDIMENIGKEPALIHGSVHGKGFTGMKLGSPDQLPSGEHFAAGFHTYGLLWSPGKIQYYVDNAAHPYATFTPADLPAGAVWPFDDGQYFFLLNLAMGGDWPGNPTTSTANPSEMLVDYVRVYQTNESQRKRTETESKPVAVRPGLSQAVPAGPAAE